MDQEQQRRERLYEAFNNYLSKEGSSDEFDENDLIDIYDYANDIGDEYVQFEVIMFASRFFPESGELTQRRAYFLYDNLSMSNGAEVLAEKHKNENALWDILGLLVKNKSEDENIKALNGILEAYSDFDDETIIQLVAAAVDLGLYDWLWEKKDIIQAKCQYPTTFLYELSREAVAQDDFQNRLKVIDELTSIDPFSEMYWHMLAQTYVMLGNNEEAYQAIEYAIAIDPDSIESRITKAQLLFDMDKDKSGALAMINKVLEEDPNNLTAWHTAMAMNLMADNESEARRIMLAYMGNFPDDFKALDRIFVFSDSKFSLSILREYINITQIDEGEWLEWAKVSFEKAQFGQAADILLAWLYEKGTVCDWAVLIESLYRQSRLEEIVSIYRNYLEDKDVRLWPLESYLLMSSLFETKNIKEALVMAEKIINTDLNQLPRVDLRLMAVGAADRAQKMIAIVKSAQKPTEESDKQVF